MGNYRNISLGFWTDTKVDDDFTPEDKYFYLYLLTNPHTNICGCYEISMKQLERETGYNEDTIKRLLHRMSDVHNVIRYNADTKEVLILNWSKYNWSSSEKLLSAVLSVAMFIKDESFRNYIEDKATTGIDNREQITDNSNRIQITETDTETDTDTDVSIRYGYPMDTISEKPKKQTKRFVKPTPDEISAYIFEQNLNVDPDAFYDYYESNGWMAGKNHMKDWKATVRNWDRREQKSKPAAKPSGNVIDDWFNS